jgi:hypothetical protein
LFTPDVEKTYDAIRSLASAKVQITNAHLETASSGQVAGHINILIEPEESASTISKIKDLGRREAASWSIVAIFPVRRERETGTGDGIRWPAELGYNEGIHLSKDYSMEET